MDNLQNNSKQKQNLQHAQTNSVAFPQQQSSRQYDLDLRDYAYIIIKRKSIIIAATILTGLFSFIFATSKTPIYTASASVKIEESQSPGLIPGYYSYSSFSIYTEMQIVTSFPVVSQVCKELGYLDPDLTDDQIRNSEEYLMTVMGLQSQIETSIQEGTTIINIGATSSDREFTKRLSNVTAQKYKEYYRYLKTKQKRDAIELIKTKIETTESLLFEKEKEMNDFRRKHQIVTIMDELSFTSSKLNTIELEYEALTKRIVEVESLINHIKNKDLTNEEERPLVDTVNAAYRDLNMKLFNLLVRKKELPLDYTNKHPEILKINRQIHDIKKMMLDELKNESKSLQVRKTVLAKTFDDVTAKSRDLPEKERELLRLTREIRINEELLTLLKTKYQEIQINESQEVGEVTIVSLATLPQAANTGGKFSTILVGLLIGLMFGVVLAIIRETLDTSVGTMEDVEDFLQIPVLGMIPHMDVNDEEFRYEDMSSDDQHKRKKDIQEVHLISQFEPKSTVAESYRALRTNLQFATVKTGGNTFMLCSPYMKEGKTTTTTNLAITMAQDGNKVLLIDCDLRKPNIHRTFGIPIQNGIADIILGKISWQEAIKDITDLMIGSMKMDEIMMTPGLENLNIITSGGYPPNPSELINSNNFLSFLDEVKKEYDIVLIDSPPIIAVSDPAIIAPNVDAVVLVHKQGRVPRKVLKRAKMTLENVAGNVIGIVLNDVSTKLYPDYAKFQIQYYGHDEEALKDSILDKFKNFFNFIPYYVKFRRYMDKPVWQITTAIIATLFLIIGLIWQSKLD
ncbi:MAG: polysaccharide biosynthesis tyrosine autokinase [Pseudomonadota bacterium]